MSVHSLGGTLELLQRQLANLESFFPGQVRPIKTNEVYEVSVVVGPSRMPISLTVILPGGFPDCPPHIKVAPPVRQRWVDQEMRVAGHEALFSWHRSLSLGKIMKDIEIEFNLRPPTLIPMNPQHQTALTQSTIAFPEVDSKNAKQLQALLDEEDQFNIFFGSCSAVREARLVQNDLLKGNLSVARDNKAMLDKAQQIKERIVELQTILELEEADLRKVSEMNRETLSKYSKETLIEGSTALVRECEQALCRLIESFSEGSIDLSVFLSACKRAKFSLYQKTASLEKLRQQLK